MDMPWGNESRAEAAVRSAPSAERQAVVLEIEPGITGAGVPATLRRRRYRSALQRYALPEIQAALIAGDNQATLAPLVRELPWWKRTCDVMGAMTGLIVLAPVMLVVAITIKLTSRGPVIFKQQRTGHGGRTFTIYKFRTMVQGAEARKKELANLNEQDGPVFKITHDPRFTPIGGILRRCSLDELPQFWNVLKGDMSLVGPRPLVCEEAAQCVSWQRRRLEVTPGITCIWQARGRCDVSFEEWMMMDLTYIYARSFWVDLMILIQTIPAVLFRKGAR